jgi:LPS-assembly protein
MSAHLFKVYQANLKSYFPKLGLIICGVWVNSISLSTQAAEVMQTNQLFVSSLKYDEQGKVDLESFSQCHPIEPILPSNSVLTEPKSESGERYLSYDSAPEISPQLTHIKGNVQIKDDSSIISAEEVIIDHQKQRLTAQGNVSIESSAAYFGAESLVQTADGETKLSNAQFYLFDSHANGKAEKVEVNNKQQTKLDNLTFSTCPVGDNSWQLATSNMSLDQDKGWGEAWDTTLKVNGIPIFYFPYLSFPTDNRRKSGILTPSIGYNDKNGLNFELPYYWNIAPHMDATIALGYIEKRGTQLGTQYRWLTDKSLAEWQFEWMNNDKIVDELLQNPTPGISVAADSAERWQSEFNYLANFNQNWQLSLDSHRVSDSDYFRDFGAGLESTNETQLESQANLNYQNDIWNIELFSLTFQSLIGNESYRYLPGLNVAADYWSKSGVRWELSTQWDSFEHKDTNQLEGNRLNIKPSISYPMVSSWGFIKPKLSYQMTQYAQSSQLTGDEQKISRNVPIFTIDSGLFFDRDIQWSGESVTHSLSPRFFYSYIPYEEQSQINLYDTSLSNTGFEQLWLENRFSGHDRLGDTNHLSIAVANTLFNNKSGDAVFGFNLGRKFYFEDRKVHLVEGVIDEQSNSPWLAEISFKISQNIDFDGMIEWDPSNKATNNATSRIKFEPIENHIVNLSHRYRTLDSFNPDTQLNEEADFSFAWPMNEQWRLVGRWYNDLQRKQTIETFVGIEYESCCWAVRLVAQKYLNTRLDSFGVPILTGGVNNTEQYSDGIQLQFVFKGLGSAGQSNITQTLESGIRGYRDPFLN